MTIMHFSIKQRREMFVLGGTKAELKHPGPHAILEHRGKY